MKWYNAFSVASIIVGSLIVARFCFGIEMIDAAHVRLLDSPFKQRQELHRLGYVGELEPDRLLFNYRKAAGLPQPAGVKSYGGWDDGFIRGHFAGHYLSAASRMYVATGDESFRIKAEALIKGLAECQDKVGTGHLAAFTEASMDHYEGTGKNAEGIAVRYYVLHKTLAGLLDAYHYLGNKQALEMAKKMADRCEQRMAALTDETLEKMLDTTKSRNPHTEHGAFSDSLAELAKVTGDRRYSRLARLFFRQPFIGPLMSREDRLEGLHGNTHAAIALGMAHEAAVTQDAELLKASDFFWHQIVIERSFANGGFSVNEWIDKRGAEAAPSILEERIFPVETAESCNTHNMIKLSCSLFEQNPKPEYAAYIEQALYNHILSVIDPVSGRVTYFHPMYGDFKVYIQATECCAGSGLEYTARFNEGIYFEEGRSLYVNLYIPSELKWNGMVIRQEGCVPYQDEVILTVVKALPEPVTLKLRKPHWTDSENPYSVEAGYYVVTRTFKDGECIKLRLKPKLRIVPSRDNPKIVSAFYGPVLLAYQLGKEDVPAERISGNTRLAYKHPAVDVPPLLKDNPLTCADAKTLTFTAGKAVFKPVYETHDQRYAVYFPYLTEAEAATWRPLRATPIEPKDCVDSVVPGNVSSEQLHDMTSEKSGSGNWNLRAYRDAQPEGWFNYVLKIASGQKMKLTVTYWGADTNRVFDLFVNGVCVAEQKLDGKQGKTFFDVEYVLPAEALTGQQNLNVRFQGKNRGPVGGVFGVKVNVVK